MKRERLRPVRYLLTLGLIIILTLGIAACSKKTSTTGTSLFYITVTPASPTTLAVGFSQEFTAIGTFSDGLNEDISAQVTWTCSKTTIATIDSNGIADGVAAGTTDITATMFGITSPAVKLTVKALSSIAVKPISPADLSVGSILHFTSIGTYSDGSTADISSRVIWTSSNITVATISSFGIVTGVAAGNIIITAAMSGVTSPAISLSVISLSYIVVIEASSANLMVGSSLHLAAIGNYSGGITRDISPQVTWTSSNTSVATISPIGIATGVGVGSTNITAALSGVTSPAISLTVVSQ